MEKISWRHNIERLRYLQVIIFLHQPALLKDICKMQFLDFMKLKRMIRLWSLQVCLKTLSIYGRICRLILPHVLIQMECRLFPVILSSFHKRDRRFYIRAVKIFDRKPSMFYTMILKSLIHCWDSFEQNVRNDAAGT